MDYREMNRKAWDLRTEAHLKGAFYRIEEFLAGAQSLNDIELPFLGDVSGSEILHIQCHFGQDTLSLARMGAKVTGADLSGKAIEAARKFAWQLGLEAEFVHSDILELPEKLDRRFDLVFGSYGVVGWHPDLTPLMQVVSHFLRPGGRFILAEFHPVVWMFNPDFNRIIYPYFNTETFVEQVGFSYGSEKTFIEAEDVSWNHPLSDVLSAVIGSGMEIRAFREYDYSPYPIFRESIERTPGRYTPGEAGGLIPLVYALEAMKPDP